LNLENYTRTSTLVTTKLQRRGWIGWMMQGTPRKYTKPTYTKNGRREDPRLDGNII
jgi:hypothetical protein